MPFFSVIIPTYNRATLIKEALDSVFSQTFTDYEVIIVDDGSTDGTMGVLESYGDKIKVLKQKNSGPGAARNLGSSVSLGQYLAFLDSDDLFFPWTLSTYVHVIEQSEKPSFVAGKPFRFSDLSATKEIVFEMTSFEYFNDYFASGDEWRWWGVSSFVVRRDILKAVGGFTGQWINGEDADLAMRLGTSLGFVQITLPFTFAYREHEASAMKQNDRTLAGAWWQINSEAGGLYPGGDSRSTERQRILTAHLRPVSLECLRSGSRTDAWKIYWNTFFWNLRLSRWKYLIGFPIKGIFS